MSWPAWPCPGLLSAVSLAEACSTLVCTVLQRPHMGGLREKHMGYTAEVSLGEACCPRGLSLAGDRAVGRAYHSQGLSQPGDRYVGEDLFPQGLSQPRDGDVGEGLSTMGFLPARGQGHGGLSCKGPLPARVSGP